MDRRRHARHQLKTAIRAWSIAHDSTRAIDGECLNLSEAGAGAVIPCPWHPGQVVRIQLTVPVAAEPVVVEARLSHRNRLHCGFEFLGASEGVMTRLRNAWADGARAVGRALDFRR